MKWLYKVLKNYRFSKLQLTEDEKKTFRCSIYCNNFKGAFTCTRFNNLRTTDVLEYCEYAALAYKTKFNHNAKEALYYLNKYKHLETLTLDEQEVCDRLSEERKVRFDRSRENFKKKKSEEKKRVYSVQEDCNDLPYIDRQYVYVLSNKYMPGILKIGMTTRNVHERVLELNSATGIPFPFDIEHIITTKDCKSLESFIHEILINVRVNDKREFFELTIEEFKKKFGLDNNVFNRY